MRRASYIQHLRPKGFLPSFLFTLPGYAMAPNKPDIAGQIADCALLFCIYSLCLMGGACAINTAEDKDANQPLTYLPNPPPIPHFLGLFGLGVMAVGLALATLRGPTPTALAALSIALSWLYSGRLPFTRWRGKEIGGVDNAISSIGCGGIAILLGYTMRGAEINGFITIQAALFTLFMAASYAASQLYQLPPNASYASARNFATLLGSVRALIFGGCILLLCAPLSLYLLCLQHKGTPSILLPQLLGIVFLIAYVGGALQLFFWSRTPNTERSARFYRLVGTLLSGRICFIAAAWYLT